MRTLQVILLVFNTSNIMSDLKLATTEYIDNDFQKKLIAGENITISGDNTISASGGGASYQFVNENGSLLNLGRFTDDCMTINIKPGNDYGSIFVEGPMYANKIVNFNGNIRFTNEDAHILPPWSSAIYDSAIKFMYYPVERFKQIKIGNSFCSVFTEGPLYINEIRSDPSFDDTQQINITVGNTILELTEAKLIKLKNWLEN